MPGVEPLGVLVLGLHEDGLEARDVGSLEAWAGWRP